VGDERAGRKPTPVAVHVFPKRELATPSKAARVRAAEPVLAAAPRGARDRVPSSAKRATQARGKAAGLGRPRAGDAPRSRKRSVKGSSGTQVTITEESPPPPGSGLGELAMLGHELFCRGRVDEAKVIFEGLVLASQTDGFSRTMLGTIALAANDLERAASLFEAALNLDPSDVAALVYRGEIRLERRRVRQAIADLECAIELGSADDPFTQRARRLLEFAKKTDRR
jgi:tetratricopeptide (TPR) repeat protein